MTIWNWKRMVFGLGVAASCLAAFGLVLIWTLPFPLVPTANGGLSISPWDARVLMGTLIASLFAMTLACFGRMLPRAILILASLLLGIFALFGYLCGHV